MVMSLKPGRRRERRACGRRCSGLFAGAHVRAVGGRLSRRDPRARTAELRAWPRPSRWRSAWCCRPRCCRLYLALRDREVLRAILRAWRPSLLAGFMGAFASQFWFLAFAIATARKRAHAGAGRGAVRAGDLDIRLQAADHAARGGRHCADRDRRRRAGLGALSAFRRGLRWQTNARLLSLL